MRTFLTEFDMFIRGFQCFVKKNFFDLNLKWHHVAFLLCIEKDNEVTASHLSNKFMMTIGGAMHILDDLMMEELIEKKVLEDKRKKSYNITKKGKNILDKINDKHDELKLELMDYLGEEDSKEFIRILNRIKMFLQEVKDERI